MKKYKTHSIDPQQSSTIQAYAEIGRYFYMKSTLFGACYLGSLEPMLG